MSTTCNTIVKRVNKKTYSSNEDTLAVEEPLEIRLSFERDFFQHEINLSITMRTPGNDKELAIGFLFTEGIIDTIDHIISINAPGENIITISLRKDVSFEMKNLERHFYTSSSCGVCGKTSIEAIHTIKNSPIRNINLSFKASFIYNLPSVLRQEQNIFNQTGGLHASALFNSEGDLTLLNEDVGRHNALDKLIGSALINKLVPLENYLLLLSGRASFELIQKATMAGIKIIAAIGAPSSLAVQLAREREMTLIGFLRNEQFNIYCGESRISIGE